MDQQGQQGQHGQNRGMRLTGLTSTEPAQFLRWRNQFEMVALAAHWEDDHAKIEAIICMQGAAHDLVADINVLDPDLTLAQLLDALQARFMPGAAGAAARQEFKNARQRLDETPAEWHGRLRYMFIQAYPQVADVEHNPDLIEGYISGLCDQNLATTLFDLMPATYQEVRQIAERRAATYKRLRPAQAGASLSAIGNLGTAKSAGINAITEPGLIEEAIAFIRRNRQQRGTRPWTNRHRGGYRGRGRGRASGRGHFNRTRNFPPRPAPQTANADYNQDLICYNCGRPGHMQRDCAAYPSESKRGFHINQVGSAAEAPPTSAPTSRFQNEFGVPEN